MAFCFATSARSVIVIAAALCAFEQAHAADDQPSGIDRVSTQQILGAFPRDLRALPDGGVGFVTYAPDGNSGWQHIVRASADEDVTLVPLGPNTEPIAWSDKYIVANNARFYLVADRQTGTRITRRLFKDFSVAPVVQFDGKELIVAPVQVGIGTAFRRISVPELKVTERIDLPFTGTLLRYGTKLVGIGNYFESSYRGQPSVVVLGENLQIEKRGVIDRSVVRDNSGCDFSSPTIRDHYLIYGADCGGVHVFDLDRMQEVSRRPRIGDSFFYTFAVTSNRLAAVRTYSDEDSLEGFLFEFPSLRSLESFRLEGSKAIASSDRFYALVEPERQPRKPYLFKLNAYRIAAPNDVTSSMPFGSAFSRATTAWRNESMYAAIQAYEGTVPRLTPQDVPAMSKSDREAASWYAGMLAITDFRRKDGLDLLEALLKSQPKEADSKLVRLLDAITARNRELAAVDPAEASSFVKGKVSVTGGALPAELAWTDRYLVVARWCGTIGSTANRSTPAQIDHEIVAGAGAQQQALDMCRRGHPGIAVHDALDFSLLRFISVVSSDDVIQDNIGSVTILGDRAYVSIARRYSERGDINGVGIDLRDGSIFTSAAMEADTTLRSDGHRLLACGEWEDSSCLELNPSTLLPGQAPASNADEPMRPNPHDFQSNRYLRSGTLVVSSDRFVLERSRSGTQLTQLVIRPLREGAATRTLDTTYQSINQSGILSTDGRFAYVIASEAGKRSAELLRVAFDSGEVRALADGSIRNIFESGKYLLVSNGTALDVFDRETGEFVCRWPGMLDEGAREQLVAKDNVLLMIHNSSDDRSLTPSTVIDMRALGSASERRRARNRELRRAVDAALAEFVRERQ
jgi:hypothetical protein